MLATPGALEAAGQDGRRHLKRHQSGDWGEVCPEDAKKNEFSLGHGLRLMSAYTLPTGVKLWVITWKKPNHLDL